MQSQIAIFFSNFLHCYDLMISNELKEQLNTYYFKYILIQNRGVFPGEGSETFSITFSPQSLEESSFRAVLMLKNIPQGIR